MSMVRSHRKALASSGQHGRDHFARHKFQIKSHRRLAKDPLLGPLQNNGGPTLTRALLSVSPAIDKGHSSGSTHDQRGFTRPVDLPNIPTSRPATQATSELSKCKPLRQLQLHSNSNTDANTDADSNTDSDDRRLRRTRAFQRSTLCRGEGDLRVNITVRARAIPRAQRASAIPRAIMPARSLAMCLMATLRRSAITLPASHPAVPPPARLPKTILGFDHR